MFGLSYSLTNPQNYGIIFIESKGKDVRKMNL